ncbi:MAG: hypothetical protein DBX55_00845 [Verrucomicrobia bacterium]|nr:MAG: hypothetical protein DBX55_00845 [Verrucomicrobiota bacterium]
MKCRNARGNPFGIWGFNKNKNPSGNQAIKSGRFAYFSICVSFYIQTRALTANAQSRKGGEKRASGTRAATGRQFHRFAGTF